MYFQESIRPEESYYRDYLLDDIYTFDLDSRTKELLDATVDLVDNNWSLKQASDNSMCYSKSTIAKFINNELRHVSFELYQVARRTLNNHKNRRR